MSPQKLLITRKDSPFSANQFFLLSENRYTYGFRNTFEKEQFRSKEHFIFGAS